MQNADIYVRLVWLLTIVMTFLILFLCYLYRSMRQAQERESASFAFSNLMIEGIETERQRISRELHDTVLPEVRGQHVQDIIREICMELMPPDFTRLSLKDSLADACFKFKNKTGIECAFNIENEIDFSYLSAENQLHLYRMVQESFTNIEKHSQAKKAALIVRKPAADRILICVSDDGKGLGVEDAASDAQMPNEKLGMKSMRQRAALIGAKIDFISESGNGLMVRIEI